MKANNLVTLLVVLIAFSCSFSLPKLREVKVNPAMQSISEKYKSSLKADMFSISTSCTVFDTIETHKVIISILNAKELSGVDEMNSLAKNIAEDAYSNITNKKDFQVLEVVFINKKGNSLANVQSKRNYQFRFSDMWEKRDTITK